MGHRPSCVPVVLRYTIYPPFTPPLVEIGRASEGVAAQAVRGAAQAVRGCALHWIEHVRRCLCGRLDPSSCGSEANTISSGLGDGGSSSRGRQAGAAHLAATQVGAAIAARISSRGRLTARLRGVGGHRQDSSRRSTARQDGLGGRRWRQGASSTAELHTAHARSSRRCARLRRAMLKATRPKAVLDGWR